jgi:glyoxylase-like metal-dependent hydrolase (beta-lactamase superfamily II)
LRDLHTLLLTHIHLDHAGATGTILERVPAVRVYVHEIGAPHMADPEKLLASATRLWGDQMDALWGAFLPVPRPQMTALAGGERLELAGRSLRVAYTPGHAKHHVSFLDEQSGMAYVGDTAGIRVSGDYMLAPTPAPDIDIEAWQQSLDQIDGWQPVSLFLAHFGPVTPARAHIARYRSVLTAQAEAVRELLHSGHTEEERIRIFADQLRKTARRHLPEMEARATELAAPFEQLWYGLARYWQKKEQMTNNK